MHDLQNGGSVILNDQVEIEMEDKHFANDEVFGEFQDKSDHMKSLLHKLKINGEAMDELKSKYVKATTVMVEKGNSSNRIRNKH